MGYFKPERRIDKTSKIAVLCGGFSSERDISIRSGQNCLKALQQLGYSNSVLIDVDRKISEVLTAERIDLAYLALHGKYGEDGAIQGLLEVLGIPYTGSKVMASSVAMDKVMTKAILKDAHLPVIVSIEVSKEASLPFIIKAMQQEQVRFPVMIKPSTEGSSIGMNKADSENQLGEYIQQAFQYSDKVMIEQFIQGKDLTVGVLELNSSEIIATSILELRSKTGWYDYKAKYTHGLTEFILPAEIDDNITTQIQQYAVEAHKAVRCRGMSRVDFVLSYDNQPYILEINTIPGMTDLSDLPAQAKDIGITYNELVDIILHSSQL